MQQRGSKYFAPDPLPPAMGEGSKGQNSTFLEHAYVAYQIKWNHDCSNVVANPHDPWGGVKRSKFNFFRTWSCCI